MNKNVKNIEKRKVIDYVNANSHGEWLANKDNGWVSKSKVHSSKKEYKRNPKHKNICL